MHFDLFKLPSPYSPTLSRWRGDMCTNKLNTYDYYIRNEERVLAIR